MKTIALLCTVAITIFVTERAAKADDEIEGPSFDVTLSTEAAELRRYAPMNAAEVRVAADDTDAAGSMGFMPLVN